MVLALSALVGALHVLLPDHWVPTSILAWQRGWKLRTVASFAGLAFLIHVLLGFSFFLVFHDWIAGRDAGIWGLLALASILVLIVALFRGQRFARMDEVFRAGHRSLWGVAAVLILLGPSESLIPIFLKANHLGMGYLLPAAAFLTGTLFTGLLFILFGRAVWNRPMWIPRGVSWVERRGTVIPLAFTMAITVALWLRA